MARQVQTNYVLLSCGLEEGRDNDKHYRTSVSDGRAEGHLDSAGGYEARICDHGLILQSTDAEHLLILLVPV